MKHFDQEEFRKHFQGLGIRPGSNVVVHSRLLSFGRCRPQDALSALTDHLGPDSTVAMPTYVFGSQIPYDRALSEPTGMGALSTLLWTQPGTIRSHCPVHNHIANGPRAHGLLGTDPLASFGPGTDFDWFRTEGFDLVLLGCSFEQAATFLHHVEALAKVPYRNWVVSPKDVQDGTTTNTINFRYFARNDVPVKEQFDRIVPSLGDLVQVAPAPYGRSFRIALADLERVALQTLTDDPYALTGPAS